MLTASNELEDAPKQSAIFQALLRPQVLTSAAYEVAWLYGNLVAWTAKKIARATTNTYSAETHAAVQTYDGGRYVETISNNDRRSLLTFTSSDADFISISSTGSPCRRG